MSAVGEELRVQTAVGRPELISGAVRQGAREILLCPPSDPGASGSPSWLGDAAKALAYCRTRGVKTVLDLEQPHTDRDLSASAERLRALYRRGLDAVRVNDLGVLRMARMEAPDIETHWASVRDADGLSLTRALGCARAVLSPFLSREEIRLLASRKGAPELQIPLWEPGCIASTAAPCYLARGGTDSAGRRGETCGMACRQPFGYGGKSGGTPLALRDIDLLSHAGELLELGVHIFGVALNVNTVEEAAALTECAVKAAAEPEEAAAWASTLREALGRPAGTDGFYTGDHGQITFDVEGTPRPGTRSGSLERLRGELERSPEAQRVPVRFLFQLAPRQPAKMAVDDYEGHTVYVTGPEPRPVRDGAGGEAQYNTRLYQCAGTPYRCEDARGRVHKRCALPPEDFAAMKTELLGKLSAARAKIPERKAGHFRPGVRFLPRREEPALSVQVRQARQLSGELLSLRPTRVYLPVSELAREPEWVKEAEDAGVLLVPELPCILPEDARAQIRDELARCAELGIKEALAKHPAQLAFLRREGFAVRADFAVCNSQTLKELRHLEVLSATLSMGITMQTVRDMSHVMDTEMVVYGRLPLLLSEPCLIRRGGGLCNCESRVELVDARGRPYPLLRDSGHASLLLDEAKLWLLPERSRWKRAGLWAARLSFTTENARECLQVAQRFLGQGSYEPNLRTTGHYFNEEQG